MTRISLISIFIVAVIFAVAFCEPSKRIIAFGVTGAGKSTLLNKLCGSKVFEEGANLKSKTKLHETVECNWLGTKDKITLIDTPGFFDNENESLDLLQSLVAFLSDLKGNGGFNLGLFLVPVTSTRFDSSHLQSIDLLASLMGHEVFSHIKIVLTQANRLDPNIKDEVVQRYLTEAPAMLQEAGHDCITRDLFMVCDLDNFGAFAAELETLLNNYGSWEPTVAEQFDPRDPDSMIKLIAQDKNMQSYLSKYQDHLKGIEELKMALARMNEDNNRLKERYERDAREAEERYNELERDLRLRLQQAEQRTPGLGEILTALLQAAGLMLNFAR